MVGAEAATVVVVVSRGRLSWRPIGGDPMRGGHMLAGAISTAVAFVAAVWA